MIAIDSFLPVEDKKPKLEAKK